MNLLNFNRPMMREYFESLGEKKFHADQVFRWIHMHGVTDFDAMSNLPKSLRDHLKKNASIEFPEIIKEQLSKDGTKKWLLKCKQNDFVEMVFIPEPGRGTLCISSQAGCPLGCKFCSTGKQKFKRNLEVFEIISQLWLAFRCLTDKHTRYSKTITNVVLMGMGEPLLNLENVIVATDIMMDDLAYGLSKYRVTVSTAGIVPAMNELAKRSDVSLAISLHAPNDEIRSHLMPINKKYPLKELMLACKNYFSKNSKRKISFEYIMLKDINDKIEHAKELLNLLKGVPAKINLIPYNEVPNLPFKPSTPEAIENFRKILLKAGYSIITRKKRGADINAACGQLAGKSGSIS